MSNVFNKGHSLQYRITNRKPAARGWKLHFEVGEFQVEVGESQCEVGEFGLGVGEKSPRVGEKAAQVGEKAPEFACFCSHKT